MSTLIYTRNKNGRAILAISNKQATERIELETTAYLKTCNYFTAIIYLTKLISEVSSLK